MAKTNVKNNRLDTQGVIKSEMSVYDNLTETAIRITESKARLIYKNYFNRCSGERVVSLFGLFITFLVTLLTSDFKDILEIEGSSNTLNAIFIILTIVFAVATIINFFSWMKDRKCNNENSFIEALKGNEAN